MMDICAAFSYYNIQNIGLRGMNQQLRQLPKMAECYPICVHCLIFNVASLEKNMPSNVKADYTSDGNLHSELVYNFRFLSYIGAYHGIRTNDYFVSFLLFYCCLPFLKCYLYYLVKQCYLLNVILWFGGKCSHITAILVTCFPKQNQKSGILVKVSSANMMKSNGFTLLLVMWQCGHWLLWC